MGQIERIEFGVFVRKAWAGGHLRQTTYSFFVIAQLGAEISAFAVQVTNG